MQMRIGVTERGDAGINLDWISKVNTVDGMILITKILLMNLNQKFLIYIMTDIKSLFIVLAQDMVVRGSSQMYLNIRHN